MNEGVTFISDGGSASNFCSEGDECNTRIEARTQKLLWVKNYSYFLFKTQILRVSIDDRTLYEAFINVFNAMLEHKEHFINKWRQQGGDDLLQKYKTEQFIELFRAALPLSKFDIDLYFKLIEKNSV